MYKTLCKTLLCICAVLFFITLIMAIDNLADIKSASNIVSSVTTTNYTLKASDYINIFLPSIIFLILSVTFGILLYHFIEIDTTISYMYNKPSSSNDYKINKLERELNQLKSRINNLNLPN